MATPDEVYTALDRRGRLLTRAIRLAELTGNRCLVDRLILKKNEVILLKRRCNGNGHHTREDVTL